MKTRYLWLLPLALLSLLFSCEKDLEGTEENSSPFDTETATFDDDFHRVYKVDSVPYYVGYGYSLEKNRPFTPVLASNDSHINSQTLEGTEIKSDYEYIETITDLEEFMRKKTEFEIRVGFSFLSF
ncbi:MAG: hypothetical protein AAGF77_13750, partial [Bacteroidota bacterium]